MLKAVIFDQDGVLINSEPLHYAVDKQLLREYGVDLTYEYYKQFIGQTETHMWTTIINDFNMDETLENLKQKASDSKDAYIEKNGYPVIDDVVDFIAKLKNAGFKLAVASSSTPHYIKQVAKAIGTDKYFDKLVSGEIVEKPKPAPDVFLEAAKQLGVAPSECVVVEDSENGSKAAKAAGMACIGFVNPDSGNQDLSVADYLVEAYEGLDADFVNKVYCHHFGES